MKLDAALEPGPFAPPEYYADHPAQETPERDYDAEYLAALSKRNTHERIAIGFFQQAVEFAHEMGRIEGMVSKRIIDMKGNRKI